jgi:hypothetical protein
LALQGGHGSDGLEVLFDGFDFLRCEVNFEGIRTYRYTKAPETVAANVCDVSREIVVIV